VPLIILKFKYMLNPLVSIVIPCYNSAKYIERLMGSLFNQTYTNWEAIIVDNNSTDDTIKLLEMYKDSRIKIYSIINNGIIAKSRNLGIIESKGEWIAFLDSDDWWLPSKLEIASNYFNKDIDLIYHKLKISSGINLDSLKSLYSRRIKNGYKELLIHGNFIPNSSVLVKKKNINKVGLISENINLVGSEDYNFLLRFTKHTNRIKFIPKKLGYYYMNPIGVSRKQMSISHREAIDEFIHDCSQKEFNYISGHLAYMDANFLIKKSNYLDSKRLLLKAINYGTFRIKIRSIIILFRILAK